MIRLVHLILSSLSRWEGKIIERKKNCQQRRKNKLLAHCKQGDAPWFLWRLRTSTSTPSIACNNDTTTATSLKTTPAEGIPGKPRQDHFIHLQHLRDRFRPASVTVRETMCTEQRPIRNQTGTTSTDRQLPAFPSYSRPCLRRPPPSDATPVDFTNWYW